MPINDLDILTGSDEEIAAMLLRLKGKKLESALVRIGKVNPKRLVAMMRLLMEMALGWKGKGP